MINKFSALIKLKTKQNNQISVSELSFYDCIVKNGKKTKTTEKFKFNVMTRLCRYAEKTDNENELK